MKFVFFFFHVIVAHHHLFDYADAAVIVSRVCLIVVDFFFATLTPSAYARWNELQRSSKAEKNE